MRPLLPLLALLLASLRGNIIVYQGEELGLTQVEIPYEQIQDPEALANWPLTLSRDGARTPMPWQAHAPHGGFTTGRPWLPMSTGNIARAIEALAIGEQQDRGILLPDERKPAGRTEDVDMGVAGARRQAQDRVRGLWVEGLDASFG